MGGGLADSWRRFWRETPGRRFEERYRRVNSGRRALAGRAVRVTAGVLLVVLGVFFGPLPGPGFVPLLLGASLLAGESVVIARGLDRAEVRIRRWLGR